MPGPEQTLKQSINQKSNDQGPMGCDEDVRFWEGVSWSIHSLECGDVWQQPAGIPFSQGLFATLPMPQPEGQMSNTPSTTSPASRAPQTWLVQLVKLRSACMLNALTHQPCATNITTQRRIFKICVCIVLASPEQAEASRLQTQKQPS